MDNKNKTLLVVLIIVGCLLFFGLGLYTGYSKGSRDKNILINDSQNTTTDDTGSDIGQTNAAEGEVTSKYYLLYIDIGADPNTGFKLYHQIEIELNSDNTARVRSGGTGAGSAFSTGTYIIEGDIIKLSLRDDYYCSEDKYDPSEESCNTSREYKMLEDGTLSDTLPNGNGEVHIYKPVDKSELKFMNE